MERQELKKMMDNSLEEAKAHSDRLSLLIAAAKKSKAGQRDTIMQQIELCRKDWTSAMEKHSSALTRYMEMH